MWCYLGWHSWDNKDNGYEPECKIRNCKRCGLKQEWKARSLWLALQTDAPMGWWVKADEPKPIILNHIYTIKKEGERFRVDHTTNPSTCRWVSWHENIFNAKEQIPEEAYFMPGPYVMNDVLEIWSEDTGPEIIDKWLSNGF